ncbi:hypothetical protein DY000_02059558 [Brassica cretica]|uniref:DUF7792 domain-containing protein n=1 Tax=Brassica cretica TaxID=69181 RepID=A0ABQ7B159_BRACR|nr:hypothetical protein DY000_02059558 [Brassica cretica]
MRQECVELKAKTEKLAGLLRQVGRASSDLYERPTHRIIDDTEQILDQAFSLVRKCRANDIMKHVFTIISSTASARCLLSWRTLSVTFLGSSVSPLPLRITVTLHIALLHTGPLEDHSNAAASLVSLARDSDCYTKLITAEGGIKPFLIAGEQVSAAAHFTCCCNSTRETMDFFTRAKQVKRIDISDQHSLATQKKDMYGL